MNWFASDHICQAQGSHQEHPQEVRQRRTVDQGEEGLCQRHVGRQGHAVPQHADGHRQHGRPTTIVKYGMSL